MRALSIISGPPGAGKSTTADRLVAASNNGVHIRADDFWHFIHTGYLEPWREEAAAQNAVVMCAIAQGAACFAAGGYDAVVDGVIGPWFLDPFVAAAGSSDLVLNYLVLRPSLEVTLRRAVGRAGGALRGDEPVRKMYVAFSELGDLEARVIDTSDLTPNETASLVHAGLSEGRFRLQ